jgi:glycine/D-amino acid oxidase-like deaminating enzyme
MKYIYPEYTYSDKPRQNCWWDSTITAPVWPTFDTDQHVDVAIIGAGFTGLSAAMHLAEAGITVAVLDAKTPGWGASGRNGGFCCLGGSKRSEKGLVRDYGAEIAAEYFTAEEDAVDLVEGLIARLGLNVDRHSNGETKLAHRPSDMRNFEVEAAKIEQETGIAPQIIDRQGLAAAGMRADFYGALTSAKGFALNPQKYLFGLAAAAQSNGAKLFQNSPVTAMSRTTKGWSLETQVARLQCDKVLVCTNGYSSETVPKWMAGRYIPTQSTAMVTRPLSQIEIDAQGWSSRQMCYDTRHLLHYFRLMPDNRMLFGARGGISGTATSDAKATKRLRSDFDKIFPAWRDVDISHQWSGMVCLSRKRLPFAGAIPDHPDAFAGFAYHGNGVAMGSYTGRLLANLVRGVGTVPRAMAVPPRKFELGRWRRAILPVAYAGFHLADI